MNTISSDRRSKRLKVGSGIDFCFFIAAKIEAFSGNEAKNWIFAAKSAIFCGFLGSTPDFFNNLLGEEEWLQSC